MNENNLTRKEYLILFSALLGLFFFIFKIFINTSKGPSGGKEYAGATTHIIGKVKRKGAGEFSWEELSKNSQIFWDDSIFAGKDSKTKVRLEQSGIEITLNQQSNLIIEKIKGKSTLNLVEGTLLTEFSKKSEIDLMLGKNKVAKISSNNPALLKIDKSKKTTNIVVKKGAVETKIAGFNKVLTKKSNLIIEKNQKMKVEIINVSLLSPAPGEILWSKNNQSSPLTFSWDNVEKNQKIVLSQSSNFENILIEQNVQKNSIVLNNLPLDQTLYWRIKSDLNTSDYSSFLIKSNSTPQFNHSSLNLNLSLSKNEQLNGKAYSINWKDKSTASHYRLQISSDFNFSTISEDRIIDDHSTNLIIKKEGQLFIRVKAIRGDKIESPWSSTLKVTAELKKKLPAPKINFNSTTRNKSFFFVQLIEFFLSSAFAADQNEIRKKISWNHVEGAIGYKIIIYKDPDQSQIIKEIELENTSYDLQFMDYGKYFWKIAAYDDDGELGEWSSLQILEASQPPLEESKGVIVKKKPVTVEKPVVTKAIPSKEKELTSTPSNSPRETRRIRLLAGARALKIQQTASNDTTDILTKEAIGSSVLGLKIEYEYFPKISNVWSIQAGGDFSSLTISDDNEKEVQSSYLSAYGGASLNLFRLFKISSGFKIKPRYLLSYKDGINPEINKSNKLYLYQNIFIKAIPLYKEFFLKMGGEAAQLISPVLAELTFKGIIEIIKESSGFNYLFIMDYELQKRTFSIKDSSNSTVAAADVKNNFFSLLVGVEKDF